MQSHTTPGPSTVHTHGIDGMNGINCDRVAAMRRLDENAATAYSGPYKVKGDPPQLVHKTDLPLVRERCAVRPFQPMHSTGP